MRVKKLVISSVMVAVTSFATIGVVNAGEQCVAAVRALVSWATTKNGSDAKCSDRIYLKSGKVRIDKTKNSSKMVDEFLRKS